MNTDFRLYGFGSLGIQGIWVSLLVCWLVHQLANQQTNLINPLRSG
jgi:hypothetical protein